MAKRLDKEKALELRSLGWSYSQIKKEIGVSKGALSDWLCDFPLTRERIKELRDNSQIRIEKSRQTKALKRKDKLESIYSKANNDIGSMSDREIRLCGLFLYWAEGTKAARGVVTLSNTDPGMLKFFLRFLIAKGVLKSRIYIRLQLYKDMEERKEMEFWSAELGIQESNFKKSYIKKSNLIDLTYKNGFGHGTCSIIVYDMNLYDEIMMSIKCLRNGIY